jgi:hypothetical protein
MVEVRMGTAAADAGFLDARQEAFCRNFVAGGSAVAAARAAGYAQSTARAQAARLLQQPDVQARIDALRADEASAKAALCGRLLQDAQHIRETAMDQGDFATALRAVNTTLRLVRTLGMPALPADTHDVLLDGAAAEADAAEADADEADADEADAADDADDEIPAADTAMLADVGECRSVAPGAATGEAPGADPNADPDLDPRAQPDAEGMLADVGACRSVDRAADADGAAHDQAVAAPAVAGVSGTRVMDGTVPLRPMPGRPAPASGDEPPVPPG